jgi:hypothetical protein
MSTPYDSLTLEEREDCFYAACESWHETWAEAGSGHVFGGGSPSDAYLVASWAAGPKPRREDFGLPPRTLPEAPKVETDGTDYPDDEIPF